jgi:uncharacterized protein (DUF305 family)
MMMPRLQPPALPMKFFTLVITAIAASSTLLTACQSGSTDQATNSPAPAANSSPHMMGDHAGHAMMTLGPADQEFDLRFIDAMIPHHQGAIAMAKDVQQQSQQPELQKMTTAIIQAQEQEIAEMKQWRKNWYPQAPETPMTYDTTQNKTVPMPSAHRQSLMMHQSLGAAGAEFESRFIDAMIPHHQGAIAMAKEALEKSQRPEIKQLAQAIIQSQQAEIEQMQQWRQAGFEASAPKS